MQRKQSCGIRLCGLFAAAVAVSFAGCESRVAPDSTTATSSGREVFDPSKPNPQDDSGSETANVKTSSAEDYVAKSNEVAAREAREIRIPVVAPRPAATEPEPENVAEQSPSDDASNVLASNASPQTSPQITDPNVDPSQFPGGIIPASPNAEPLPGGPRLLVPERRFRPEGRPRALRVNYDDLDLLKVLNMGDPLPGDVVDQFPDWLSDLDGKTIRLRGFMYPSYQPEMKAFILTRDTGACCFGPNPKVYYLVGVKLKEGTTVKYIGDRPFDVVGTFEIAPVYTDGQWYQLYKITDATVIQ